MNPPLLLLAQLTLPGYALASLLRLPGPRFLHSVGLSFALFVLLFVTARLEQWSIEFFGDIYLGIAGALLFLAATRYLRAWRETLATLTRWNQEKRGWIWVAPVLTGILLAYLAWVGPYLEIPSDAFAHLKFMQLAAYELENFPLADATTLTQLMNSHTWYDFVAYSLSLTETSIGNASHWIYLITTPLFLLSVYSFAAYLYENSDYSRAQKIAFASLATIFVALHMGVNIFSFIRYYALAPAMINFILYFAAMSLVLSTFRNAFTSLPILLVAIVYFITMLIAHTQEALFMAVMTILLAIYYSFSSARIPAGQAAGYLSFAIQPRQIAIMTGISLIMVASGWVYIHHVSDFKSGYLTRVMEIAHAGNEHYFILNPTNNFYQSLTHWGVAIYLLFLVYFRDFLKQPYLFMGMLSPLFTVFNPFFIDLFLRFYSDNTLWRFAYLAPIHFSAAHITVTAWGKFKSEGSRGKSIALISVAVIILLLLPVNTMNFSQMFSRYATMQKVGERNSPAYLSDLLDMLNRLPARQHILTDPTTAYVISAMTRQFAPSHKFFPRWDYLLKNKRFYDATFDKSRNSLLIINEREGNESATGRISRHWYADALKTGKYYSNELKDFIRENPHQFEKLWQQDKITVYRIQPRILSWTG